MEIRNGHDPCVSLWQEAGAKLCSLSATTPQNQPNYQGKQPASRRIRFDTELLNYPAMEISHHCVNTIDELLAVFFCFETITGISFEKR
jgi:hypothetical protein